MFYSRCAPLRGNIVTHPCPSVLRAHTPRNNRTACELSTSKVGAHRPHGQIDTTEIDLDATVDVMLELHVDLDADVDADVDMDLDLKLRPHVDEHGDVDGDVDPTRGWCCHSCC